MIYVGGLESRGFYGQPHQNGLDFAKISLKYFIYDINAIATHSKIL